MKRSYTTMSGGVLGPRKKRKISAPLTSLELARVREARAVAEQLPWSTMNYPIRSGAPSGLYNLATSTKEYKFVDTTLGTSNNYTQLLPGTPLIYLLNGLSLGTAAYQRIGNKVTMRSIYWNVAIGMDAIDTDPATTTSVCNTPCRFMIIYDKQPNGATFAINDLLTDKCGIANSTNRPIDFSSPNNLNNRDRFLTIVDKRFVLQSNGTTARHLKNFRTLVTPSSYKSGATSGDITDITSGALYAVVFCDYDLRGATGAGIGMTGDIRMRYQDD